MKRQNRANAERRGEGPAQALAKSDRKLARGGHKPKAMLHIARARALGELGRYDDALESLSIAIGLDPNDADAFFELGLVFEGQDKPLEAFAAYQRTVDLQPREVRAYNNMAGLLVGLGQLDLAIATSRAAVALAPDHPDVYLNLGTALRLRGDDEEALDVYRRIVALKPDHGEALVELCHRRQHACDWAGLREQQAESLRHSYRKGCRVSPFAIMTSTSQPLEQLLCARVWGAHLSQANQTPLAHANPRPVDRTSRRLRLGYLSADFHSHATAMLIVDMLEQHDGNRFELFGYSLGPDDGSAMRHRLVAAFDHFIDLRGVSDRDAAVRIATDAIDILLDLKGYTQNARVKILAMRPAPIQINYLGFPGTMGAPFIDYIIADRHVAPSAHAAFYDETIVHLPNCYQPNDRRRAVAAPATRRDFNLPEDGFVFCCFNNSYKITPDVFDIWMRLLDATPGAVLWLLEPNRQAAGNLRSEAARRGIAPERLVFAPFVAADRHLARLQLADLFLDTLPVNAHTTASEALWVGLPLLTCKGETFAGRVAASLLYAIEAPELVTDSLVAYEAAALQLAHDHAALARIRTKLMRNRQTSALFDTPRYTKHFEAALIRIADRHDAGEAPESFAIEDRP